MARNRERTARELGIAPPTGWAWLTQVHGADVRVVDARPRPGEPPVTADAAVTTLSHAPLVVLTADCAPVAIADDVAVGVVHVGWRGLLAGVVASAVAALRSIGRGPVQAVVGPCIRPAHYEFGRTDLDRLVERFGAAVEATTLDGHPALDLAAGVRAACIDAGVVAVDDTGDDTVVTGDRYFSHRRDGTTGRQALIVVKD